MADFLKKEDYEEPRCLLNMQPQTERIPTGRMIDRLDVYLSHNDYAAAERHLQRWLEEAEYLHDDRGRLTVLNEQIGLYRKLGKKGDGLMACAEALILADELYTGNSVTLGTTYINAATAYKAFGMADEALPLYEKAQRIYEAALSADDARLGGLYNNMALAVMELGDHRGAQELFEKAIGVMTGQEHGEAETAITYLNLADLVTAQCGAQAGAERIGEYLRRAQELLDTPDLPRDGNYAFVCEKCAPVFGFYGYTEVERELASRAREIYERS